MRCVTSPDPPGSVPLCEITRPVLYSAPTMAIRSYDNHEEANRAEAGERVKAGATVPVGHLGGIVLISCYELGQQPLGLASPAAHLDSAGFPVVLNDLAVEGLNETVCRRASIVGISVPMHTAMRLGIGVSKRVRSLNPACHIVFYGLYAALNSTLLLEDAADSCFGGEFEEPLVDLVRRISEEGELRFASPPPDPTSELRRGRRSSKLDTLPERKGLPPLDRYTKLVEADGVRTVGYVATARGCKHLCRHCPIPPVYGGSFYALPTEVVMDDIAGLVDRGARHITFADPDFLNGPSHAQRIAEALHSEFPRVTFDFTAKVEHLLRHAAILPKLQASGCLFVVSAIETLSDRTLAILRKHHTRADVLALVRRFSLMGLTLRPSLMPFTPWDSLDDYIDLLDFVEKEGLIDNIEPVQYSIRLLVPPGSLLLRSGDMQPHLGEFDRDRFSFRWTHPDPRMDRLQKEVYQLTDIATRRGDDMAVTFYRIRHRALERRTLAGQPEPSIAEVERLFPPYRARPPRLTEDWFC